MNTNPRHQTQTAPQLLELRGDMVFYESGASYWIPNAARTFWKLPSSFICSTIIQVRSTLETRFFAMFFPQTQPLRNANARQRAMPTTVRLQGRPRARRPSPVQAANSWSSSARSSFLPSLSVTDTSQPSSAQIRALAAAIRRLFRWLRTVTSSF